MKYQAPKVSRYFHYDWQFAVDMSNLPLLRPASLVIGFMPLITEASLELFGLTIVQVPLSAWIMWFSSVAFIASWLILRFKCPRFIQQYRDYGQYRKREHAHRWILWLFYYNISQLSSWRTIVRETHAKGLSIPVNAGNQKLNVCPAVVRDKAESDPVVFPEPESAADVTVFYPENIGRDLYIPLHCDGQRRLLYLEEDDPKLAQKEKELFWILFTQAAKESPGWRVAFWCLFYISVGLIGINVLKNVLAVVSG